MDKRYQVFVSSTYLDLKDERREVMQTLLEMECIPAGMELFPAADDDAWELIKGVINQSDYYLVVIGGKYGSLDDFGISYTKKEYDYAISQNKPVAAFLHEDPTKLALENSELNAETREKLTEFREKIENAHHCKYWSSSDGLGGKVAKSMNLFFRSKPGVGWIKANTLPQEVTEKIQTYVNRIEELETELSRVSYQKPEGIEDLESGNDGVSLSISVKYPGKDDSHIVKVDTSWDELFVYVGPSVENPITSQSYRSQLAQSCKRIYLKKKKGIKIRHATIGVEDFQIVKYQLFALGLVEKYSREGGNEKYWGLTKYGERKLIHSLVRKKV